MEKVNLKPRTIDAIYLPKRFFDAELEVSKNLNIADIHLGDYMPSFSRRSEIVIDPTVHWDIVIRDGTELKDLESAVRQILGNAQAAGYYGARKMKLKIKFEANLGEIWLELVNTTIGETISSYTRTAETVTARCSGVYARAFAEYDELCDIPIIVHANTVMKSIHSKGDVSELLTDVSMGAVYSRLLTIQVNEIDAILEIFLSNQSKDKIKEFSDEELSALLKTRGRKMLPLSIQGMCYVGGGQPRLVLDGYGVTFNGETANKEANLAEVIFKKGRNLSQVITYEDIFEALEGGDWLDLTNEERKARIKDYKQRMRQLNYHLGSMLGLGEINALVSADGGIAINHRLL